LSQSALGLSGSERVVAFDLSFEKYAAALALKPDDHEALNNWGLALSQSALGHSGSERVAAFDKSIDKYAAALALKPDYHKALNNWGGALIAFAQGLSDGARKDCLRDAEDKLNQAQTLSGQPSYNLACLYALRGETAQALDQLEACADAGTLPDAEHLRQDSDLDSLRAEPRCQVLLD
jgi:tetratricopeptide (TPR) repeat protein